MQATTLYFVRHGETEYNRLRIMQGRRINSTLNETGRRQAQALAARLAEVPLDAIYTSSMRRAVETGAAVAERHPGVPVAHLEDLDEMSWGIHEGVGHSDGLQEALDRIYARWEQGEFEYRVEEGESILDVQTRALRAVDEIVERHPGETVLVVAHGRLLRVLLASLLDEYGLERMHEIEHANTSVNRVVLSQERYEADLLNCTAHLEEADLLLLE